MKLQRLTYFIPVIISTLFLGILFIQVYPNFLAVHDSPLKLLPAETLIPVFSFWSLDNFGYTNYLINVMSMYPIIFSYISLLIGIPTFMMQLSLYFLILNLLMYSSWYSIYKFLDLLGYKRRLFASLFASLLFSFNLYIIASWHGGSIDGLFITYALSPILLYLVIKNILYSISRRDAMLYTLVFIFSMNTLPYAAAIYVAYFIPFFYIKYLQNILYKTVKQFIPIMFSAVLISSFYLYTLILAFTRSDPSPLINYATAYAFSDYGILGNLLFYFDWTINQIWGSRYFHSYFHYYNNSFVAISTLVILFIIFVALIKIIKSTQKHIIGYLFMVLTISLFVSKSLNYPLGFINKFFYDYVPFMNLFRTPDTKFGLAFVTAISFLTGLAFVVFQRNRLVTAILSTAIFVHIGIFFIGIPIIEIKENEFHTRIVHIPEEYKQIAAILNKDNREGSVLLYPGLSYANYNYMNDYGLNGQDILGKLIERPKIYTDGFIFGKAKIKYSKLTESMYAKELGENSVRYLIIRKDIYETYPESTLEKIKNVQNLKIIYRTRIADVYEIDPSLYTPYIFTRDNHKNISLIYKEILPNLYKINLTTKNSSNLEIKFNTSYHKDWHLYSFDDVKINSHEIDMYSNNIWSINLLNKNDTTTIYLVFIPQYIFFVPLLVSVISGVWFVNRYWIYAKTK